MWLIKLDTILLYMYSSKSFRVYMQEAWYCWLFFTWNHLGNEIIQMSDSANCRIPLINWTKIIKFIFGKDDIMRTGRQEESEECEETLKILSKSCWVLTVFVYLTLSQPQQNCGNERIKVIELILWCCL